MSEPASGRSVFLEAAPFLLVADVVKSADYYRDKLGFLVGRYFGEPKVFVIVKRNATRIMLRQVPAGTKSNADVSRDALDLYVWVSDVDALAKELSERGADIVDQPEDEGGRREMVVRDLDGHHLCFGQVPGWPD
jgi:predicted lactoylglutathione lyase